MAFNGNLMASLNSSWPGTSAILREKCNLKLFIKRDLKVSFPTAKGTEKKLVTEKYW